ncbi:MAG: hypothetical protein KQA41_00370 [Candidatus Aenigmarchaeota archaeon]|nr:hypothetical protein [Candidatus Aenigmarchaeota archaeon]
MKGISAVIATLLLIVITVGLAGTAYFFINNIAENSMQNNFQILEVSGNKIIISNFGTKPIMQNDLKIIVDNTPVSFSIDNGVIDPNKVGIVTISSALSEGMHRLIVLNKGSSQTVNFYYYPTVSTTTTRAITSTSTVSTTTTRAITSTSTVSTTTTIVSCYVCGYYNSLSACGSNCPYGCLQVSCQNNPNCWRCITTTTISCYSCNFYPSQVQCIQNCQYSCIQLSCGNNPNCWRCR